VKNRRLFTLALCVFAVVALGELYLTYDRWMASRAAAKTLVDRTAELQGMTALNPPPKREVAAAIEADLAKAQASLAAMQGELKGRGPAAERIRAAKLPANRTDAFFDLATFVEKTRELAKKHEVGVRPEAARLGFSAYANEGPAADHIDPVFRQRQIAQYLIETLIEAKPRALLSVRREHTLGKAEREARAAAQAAIAAGGQPDPAAAPPPAEPAGDSSDGLDYFTIDPRVTARVPGFIDTIPFRLVFTGQTAALRLFLNKLAAFELPVLVREVEVEAATAEESVAEEPAPAAEAAATGDVPAASVVLAAAPAPKPPAKAPAAKAPRPSAVSPIVSKPLSKYTVTVEFVELFAPSPPPAGDAPQPAPAS
jgi:hypothetical protein